MTYKQPPMRFNPGTKSFEVDLPIKNSKINKSKNDNNDIRLEAFIFLILIVIFIIFGYFVFKFFT